MTLVSTQWVLNKMVAILQMKVAKSFSFISNAKNLRNMRKKPKYFLCTEGIFEILLATALFEPYHLPQNCDISIADLNNALQSTKTYYIWNLKLWKKPWYMSNFIVGTVPVDGSAPFGAGPSAGTATIKFGFCIHIYIWLALHRVKPQS